MSLKGIQKKPFEVDVTINDERFFDFGEQEICKQFGCGRRLTKEEKLFGSKCISHSKKETTIKQLMLNKMLISDNFS